MRRSVRELARAAGIAAAVALCALWGSAEASALSCVERPDAAAAAKEAIQGEHPLWAMGYLVAVVESITEGDEGDLLFVAVRPTHVFAGEYPDRMTLRARSDGPPDPRIFRTGRAYFLSLGHAAPGSGELLIQPCAPNFEITPEEVADLVAVAPEVEVRQAEVPVPDETEAVGWPLVAVIAVVAVLGLGIGVIAWRR